MMLIKCSIYSIFFFLFPIFFLCNTLKLYFLEDLVPFFGD